jgi:hypothetical protein
MNTFADLVEMIKSCESMQGFEQACNLVHAATMSNSMRGDIVEFGCHAGLTARLISHVTHHQLWLYDSFQGLPERSEHDKTREDFFPGQLKIDMGAVPRTFNEFKTRIPIIIHGWFKDIDPRNQMPTEICLAHIDADFYESTKTALELVWPRMIPGGMIFVDDYHFDALPGVKVAVNEFLQSFPAIPLIVPFLDKHNQPLKHIAIIKR